MGKPKTQDEQMALTPNGNIMRTKTQKRKKAAEKIIEFNFHVSGNHSHGNWTPLFFPHQKWITISQTYIATTTIYVWQIPSCLNQLLV